MKIIRVEHSKSRKGPYMYSKDLDHGNPLNGLISNHENNPNFPTVSEDFNIIFILYNKNERCGFDSIHKVFDWFDAYDWYKLLEENGFVVCFYEVENDHVKLGKSGKQVKFNIDKSMLVDELKPLTFYFNYKEAA